MLTNFDFKPTGIVTEDPNWITPYSIVRDEDGAYGLHWDHSEELKEEVTLWAFQPTGVMGLYWGSFNIEHYVRSITYQKTSDSTSFPRMLSDYGVADSLEQVVTYYNQAGITKKHVCFVLKIRREDQPAYGGWRWHKWGPYIGNQTPQAEYLFDEPEIESVIIFQFHEVENE